MIKPTPRQLDVLREVRSFQRRKGYTPTLRDLGEALGMRSTSTVDSHLDALERKGLLQRVRHITRGLIVTPAGHAALDARFAQEAAS